MRSNAPLLSFSFAAILVLVGCGGADDVSDASDRDGDTVADDQDCAPKDPSAWQNLTYQFVDSDGDGFHSSGAGIACAGDTLRAEFVQISLGPDCDDQDRDRWANLEYRFVDDDGDGYTRDQHGTICAGVILPPGFRNFSLGFDCNDSDLSRTTLYDYTFADSDRDGFATNAPGQVCAGLVRPAEYTDVGTETEDCDDDNSTVHSFENYTHVDRDGDGNTRVEAGAVCSGASLPNGYFTAETAYDCDDDDPDRRDFVAGHPDEDGDGVGKSYPSTICGVTGQPLPDGIVPTGCDRDDTAAEVGCLIEADSFSLYSYSSSILDKEIMLSVGDGFWAAGTTSSRDHTDASGQVRIYTSSPAELGQPPLLNILQAPVPHTSQQFGESVAAYGSTLAVLAVGDEAACERCGAVYVYERDSEGEFSAPAQLLPSDFPQENTIHFIGPALALNGETIAIGGRTEGEESYLTSGAAVYVYERNIVGTWLPQSVIPLPDNFHFNLNSLSLGDDFLAVGRYETHRNTQGVYETDSMVYIYTRQDPQTWSLTQTLRPDEAGGWYFGYSIDSDGDRLIVGEPDDVAVYPFSSGSAHLYERGANGTWSHSHRFRLSRTAIPNLDSTALYGTTVAIEGDRVLIGAPRAEAAHLNRDHGLVELFARRENGDWDSIERIWTLNGLYWDAFLGSETIDLHDGQAVFMGKNSDFNVRLFSLDVR